MPTPKQILAAIAQAQAEGMLRRVFAYHLDPGKWPTVEPHNRPYHYIEWPLPVYLNDNLERYS